jgi:hypothetical protein
MAGESVLQYALFIFGATNAVWCVLQPATVIKRILEAPNVYLAVRQTRGLSRDEWEAEVAAGLHDRLTSYLLLVWLVRFLGVAVLIFLAVLLTSS